MIKKKKLTALTALLAASSALVVGCADEPSTMEKGIENGKDEVIRLSYAFFASANSFPGVQMEKFKEEIEKRSEGRVEIELYPGGTLLQADNMYQGVRDGVVDIGLSSTTYETGKYPLLEISDLPSGITSATVASQVNYNLLKDFEHEGLDGLHMVTAFAGEPAYIQTIDEVATRDDLKGLQLRISGANQDVLKVLGASPVGMSQVEAPEALQTGIIKGNVSSREVLQDFQLAEDAKYVVDYPLSTTTFLAVMNEDKMASLPKDVQELITEVGEEMAKFTGEYYDDYADTVMDWAVEEQGVKVVSLSDKEKAEWNKIFADLQEDKVEEVKAKGLDAEKYFNSFQELTEKFTTEATTEKE